MKKPDWKYTKNFKSMETQRFVEGINILPMPLLEMLQYVDCQWDAEKQRYQAAGQKHYFMLLQSWCENTMRSGSVLHFTPVKGGFTCLFDASPPPTAEEHVRC